MPVSAIRNFLKLEAAGGLLLLGASVLALLCANSPLQDLYAGFLELRVAVIVGALKLDKALLLWINDGLMAVFFLLIGLELKRETLQGELSSPGQALLPGVAAAGGLVVPALIYVWLNWGDPDGLQGWAIPTATDIAFALGVLSLLGSRVPLSLKVLLTSLAIFDDLAAIVIIAAFYTEDLTLGALGLGVASLLLLFAMNRWGVTRMAAYVLVGVLLWVFVLQSGVHATLAGVAVAAAIPLRAKDAQGHSPALHLEHTLHPWVAYLILPVFAFANAGVPLADLTWDTLLGPVPLGVALGLFLGKQLGVFGAARLAVALGIARKPRGVSWWAVYGVSVLAGIGFTMSLFIGTLAFEHGDFDHYLVATRIGVLVGSLLSALLGYAILRATSSPQPP